MEEYINENEIKEREKLHETSPEEEKKNAKKMDPEQALIILKDKFELGMITEEEYQTQRAKIISKL